VPPRRRRALRLPLPALLQLVVAAVAVVAVVVAPDVAVAAASPRAAGRGGRKEQPAPLGRAPGATPRPAKRLALSPGRVLVVPALLLVPVRQVALRSVLVAPLAAALPRCPPLGVTRRRRPRPLGPPLPGPGPRSPSSPNRGAAATTPTPWRVFSSTSMAVLPAVWPAPRAGQRFSGATLW
jgi:hypothetical protein